MRVQQIVSIGLSAAVLIIALVVMTPFSGLAQEEGGVCSELVNKALTDLGTNCTGMGRNSACYGYNRVDATFTDVVDESFFSQPTDRSEVALLQNIQTAPLDTEEDFWGIAVMNVQANVPNSLPGQAVTFLLMGDVELTNEVAPEDALLPVDPVNVQTILAANLRSGPSTNTNVIGSVPGGTDLPADGLSPDAQWLRVLYQSGPAWVSRQIIEASGDLSGLPTITSESRSPMQAFSFRTGVSDVSCDQAPPVLVVQGPQSVTVDITANGADIRISSTIALRLLPNNQMQLIVLNGSAEVDGITVPAGFTLVAEVNLDDLNQSPDWTGFRPMTPEEMAELAFLEGLEGDFLHYPIIIPTPEQIQAFLSIFGASSGGGTGGAQGPAAGQLNCSGFKATSPLSGMKYGTESFYWDGVPGATGYRVNVYDENGVLVGSGETTGGVTNLVANLTGNSSSAFLSWEVVALVNGQVACATSRVTNLREAAPPVSSGGGGSTPAPSCNYNYVCQPGLGESTSSCPTDCP